MVDILPRDPEAGARNLLQDCLGLRAGERLLLIQEDPVHGYYDAAAPACVAQVAKDLGATLETYHAPLIDGPGDVPEDMLTALGRVDHAIFFARIGDQVRFTALPGQASKTSTLR